MDDHVGLILSNLSGQASQTVAPIKTCLKPGLESECGEVVENCNALLSNRTTKLRQPPQVHLVLVVSSIG
jgi:hypothetical protein